MRRPYLPALLIAVCGAAFAQTPSRPSPGEMLQVTDATLERSIETQIAAQLKVAERPETAERLASFKKNLFDALRKKGFTAEQSLQIVIATPLPALAAGAK
ncbi:hypothetical protein Q4S45_17295 [Massilia sp. R2A-15]|uniref:hypothetical protein n=1 Tax=Massilia sp. R2A-15 TaxID=3064278 RepID=UPI002734CA6F|nr:hypothetical protein [Massilia sp. R2A-15]WLI88468.1 hypothetical protein Q4S45_17295 [Massilia sp. R2A-15]